MQNSQSSALKQFPSPDTYNYLYKSYQPRKNVAQCIDVITASCQIYLEYYNIMVSRMRNYRNLKYVFATKDSKVEVYRFLKTYPFFSDVVNIIEWSADLPIYTNQLPFCMLLTKDCQIIYEGSVVLENYVSQLTYLNSLQLRHESQLITFLNVQKSDTQLQNRQLGIVLSGLQQKPKSKLTRLQPIKTMFGSNSYFEEERSERVVSRGSLNNSISLFDSSREFKQSLEKLKLPTKSIRSNAKVSYVMNQVANLPKFLRSKSIE
ncbi:Conserved_hypothetical protein [Hexamita inflata]|uniref:Uncharacterized protein n=1 Tax=Hexamita inflata TaxID=28002 RepID=A0ABP1H907_9EUKA